MSLKAKIEAVLFLTDKPLKAQAIAAIVSEDLQLVRQTLLDLIHDYEERQGGLEIADEDGYSFQVKDQYSSLMNEFLPIEMSTAVLRTMSAIAIKQPITQSEIIRVRGASAYEHIKDLVERELVSKRDDGRSPILTTTKKFQEYFRLSKDGKSLRQYLKRQMKKQEVEAAGQLSLLPADLEPETNLGLESNLGLERFDPLAETDSLLEPLSTADILPASVDNSSAISSSANSTTIVESTYEQEQEEPVADQNESNEPESNPEEKSADSDLVATGSDRGNEVTAGETIV